MTPPRRGIRLRWELLRRRRRLLRDADALVGGHYLERLERQRERIPAWAVVNTVAHGRLDDLRRLAAAPPPALAGNLTCRDAAAWLAAQLRRVVGDDEGRLAFVQRELLIPYELAVLVADDALTVPDVVVSVRTLLGSWR